MESLAKSLDEKSVAYCHWKSNVELDKALSGETDVDLLVRRDCLAAALSSLHDFEFKRAVAVRGKDPLSISHFYAFDAKLSHLIHVHLFTSVLTGESFVKSHFLPFDRMLLENTDTVSDIRVASKPAELVIFIVRLFIKYGSLPDLSYLWQQSNEIAAELSWLKPEVNASAAVGLLKKHCPVLEEGLFTECLDALTNGHSIVTRFLLALRVRRRLRVYRTRTFLGRVLAYVRLASLQLKRRLGRNRKNRTFSSGGALIAFVGPDATGKSTLISESRSWLGSAFSVKTIHAGRPPSAWLTAPLNFALSLARGILPRSRYTRNGADVPAESSSRSNAQREGISQLVFAVRAVMLAWDRLTLVLKARRAAAAGWLVLSDRYPSNLVGAMDGPRLSQAPSARGVIAKLCRSLTRLETRLYGRIPPPDTVLRLRVSVDTAIKRNRERNKPAGETDANILSRHRQGVGQVEGALHIYEVDTGQALEETILNVKKLIWRSL